MSGLKIAIKRYKLDEVDIVIELGAVDVITIVGKKGKELSVYTCGKVNYYPPTNKNFWRVEKRTNSSLIWKEEVQDLLFGSANGICIGNDEYLYVCGEASYTGDLGGAAWWRVEKRSTDGTFKWEYKWTNGTTNQTVATNITAEILFTFAVRRMLEVLLIGG